MFRSFFFRSSANTLWPLGACMALVHGLLESVYHTETEQLGHLAKIIPLEKVQSFGDLWFWAVEFNHVMPPLYNIYLGALHLLGGDYFHILLVFGNALLYGLSFAFLASAFSFLPKHWRYLIPLALMLNPMVIMYFKLTYYASWEFFFCTALVWAHQQKKPIYFTVALGLLVLLRASFHLLLFLPLVLLVQKNFKLRWNKLANLSASIWLLAFLFYAKNYAMFGFFGPSNFSSVNITYNYEGYFRDKGNFRLVFSGVSDEDLQAYALSEKEQALVDTYSALSPSADEAAAIYSINHLLMAKHNGQKLWSYVASSPCLSWEEVKYIVNVWRRGVLRAMVSPARYVQLHEMVAQGNTKLVIDLFAGMVGEELDRSILWPVNFGYVGMLLLVLFALCHPKFWKNQWPLLFVYLTLMVMYVLVDNREMQRMHFGLLPIVYFFCLLSIKEYLIPLLSKAYHRFRQ